jgi:hypothetical protein
MFKFLKKDSWILGIALGALTPAISFCILYLINKYLATNHQGVAFLKDSTLHIVSIFMNVIVFRFYMLKMKFDYTGRGILLVTFIYAIVFFYFNI